MTNWTSPAELKRDVTVSIGITLILCGVATWDMLSTFWFDWQIITGKRKWKWPMVFYFMARISMLLHFWLLSVYVAPIHELPCQGLGYAIGVLDMVARVCAGLILALRTYAIWYQDKRVGVPLLLATVGQTVIWCLVVPTNITRWDPVQKACIRLSEFPSSLMITYFSYTMVLDLLIVALAIWKLAPWSREEGISSLLLRDGIIYFVSVLLGNLISTVFEALQLNSVVNLMGLPMSLIISVIASTIIFRHVFTHHESHHSGPGPSDPAAMSPSRVTPPSVSARLERQGRLGHSECLALKEITRSYGEGPIKVTKTVDIEHDGPKADDSWDYDHPPTTRAQAVVTFEDPDGKSVGSESHSKA